MEDKLCIIQFPHPGGEHEPDKGNIKDWNTGDHKRKFMLQQGKYLDGNQIKENEIVFWGEWEAQSEVIKQIPNLLPHGPNYIYKPYYQSPRDGRWKQNTDPFVFGHDFFYSNCKQKSEKRTTQLRYLKKGSLILFGSCIDEKDFVLDTLFIVRDYFDYDTNHPTTLHTRVPNTFLDVTLTQLKNKKNSDLKKSSCGGNNISLRLYFGATYNKPLDGIFSFFPCKPYSESSNGFARPIIRIPDIITDNLKQGFRKTERVSFDEIKPIWVKVVDQVTKQGLNLGIYADLPEERK